METGENIPNDMRSDIADKVVETTPPEITLLEKLDGIIDEWERRYEEHKELCKREENNADSD